ncbi:SCO family protein [Metapseudomonas lalkuanensis]|uniref:SCO family protein n=1 Tax=Metapseudomonas lalkuanensis TaxID=2604832 RepID=A0A5J6QP06_9GAMM|nr:SCO family protein [Pseudomonas lalkuanensis]QEY63051.1 SCO family protein [Pseudomonas lalkuanensis]
MGMNVGVSSHFSLIDHHGQKVADTDYRGSFMLVYFGFTHCRVVCPRALSKLSSVLDLLGEQSSLLTPLYITVDPQRDTPDVMRTYLEANYPRFTGLTGTSSQVEAVKQSFRVFAARRVDPDEPDGYAMPHTAIAYLFGPDGKYCTHFADNLEAEAIVARLKASLPDWF